MKIIMIMLMHQQFFSPNYFGKEYVYGTTDITVYYHFPTGLSSEEPRYHDSPSGFNEPP